MLADQGFNPNPLGAASTFIPLVPALMAKMLSYHQCSTPMLLGPDAEPSGGKYTTAGRVLLGARGEGVWRAELGREGEECARQMASTTEFILCVGPSGVT